MCGSEGERNGGHLDFVQVPNPSSRVRRMEEVENVYPQRLAVGVDGVYDPECLQSLDAFHTCPEASIQIASFLINLLRNSDTNTSLSVYSGGEFYDIFTDMTSKEPNGRKVDLYPFPLALTDDPWEYEYTGSTEWMPYFMYTNIRAQTTSMHQSPIRFLTSPFRWNTWIPVSLSILVACLISFLIQRSPKSLLASRLNEFSWFALFFLFTVYTSNLKALLAQPKPLDPFVNLRDLGDQIVKGKRRIVLEEENTRRWRLLADTNLSKPQEFEYLHRVLEARPDSLVIAVNQSDLCRMLDTEYDLVFFAYDDLVRTLCGDLCLWQYRISEYPVIMKAIPVVNMTAISSKMDVFLLAAFSYKEVLLNRLYKPRCGPLGNAVTLIGMESFYGPIILWTFGLSIGLITFCAEVTKAKVSLKYTF